MFKLILIITFIFSFLFSSCSSQKNDYEALIKTIESLKSPINKMEDDSIELVDHCFKIEEVLLKGYIYQKEIKLNHKVKPSYNFFEWIDKKYEWILNDSEINNMIESLRKQKKVFWQKEKLKKSKKIIKLVDYQAFTDHVLEDMERKKRIKSDKFIYFFSKPVFNKKKDIFIIQFEILLLPYSKMTLIYKKEHGFWIQIASLSPNW